MKIYKFANLLDFFIDKFLIIHYYVFASRLIRIDKNYNLESWISMEKIYSKKHTSLFIFEGKTDYLIIGLGFLLISFFLFGGFFMK